MDPFSRQKPGQCGTNSNNNDAIGSNSGVQQVEKGGEGIANSLFGWLIKAIGLNKGEEQLRSTVENINSSLANLTSALSNNHTTLPSIIAANSTLDHLQMAQPETTSFLSTTTSLPYNSSQQQQQQQQSEYPFQLEALHEGWQLFLSVLYSLTAITSFVLNVITVIVLARCGRSELRKYLINLSMSDLLMSLFSIPFTYTEYMLGRWIFSSFLCPVVRFVVTLSVFVSAATMTVIGINRHLAIIYPFRKKKCSRLRRWTIRKTHVIIAIWLIGIVISTPEYLMFGVEPFCYEGNYYNDCRQLWPDNISHPYAIFIYLFTFAIPLLLLCYLYSCIGLKLWRRRMPGNVDLNRDLTMQTVRFKVIKMLFVVVIVFVVSWLPLQTFSMVLFIYPAIRENFEYQSLKYNIFVCTYFVCHWLSMAHSCLNPLIYCFMNDKFRSDLHALICKRANYFTSKRKSGTKFTNQSSQIQLFGPLTSTQLIHQHGPGAISLQSSSLNTHLNRNSQQPDGATVLANEQTASHSESYSESADQQQEAFDSSNRKNGERGDKYVDEPFEFGHQSACLDFNQNFKIARRQVGETLFVKVLSNQNCGEQKLFVYESLLKLEGNHQILGKEDKKETGINKDLKDIVEV